MGKRIGVRYCGGCNPRYDRVAFVRSLQAAFPDLSFVPLAAAGDVCAVLVVCGCPAQCAGQGDLPRSVPRFAAAGAGDLAPALAFVREAAGGENL